MAFKQLERGSLKKNLGFNGIRTRDLRTYIAEVTGSNNVEAPIFLGVFFPAV